MVMDGWNAYESLVGRDWDTLTDDERALVAVGTLREEVNNGGFDQYFFNSAGDLAPWAVDTLVSLDLSPLERLLRRAMAVLGTDPYPLGRAQRQDRLEELGQTDEAFEDLDEEYYDLESRLDLDASMSTLASRI
jgi:hypothetical protein